MTWEIESNVIERFSDAGIPRENITFARGTYTFEFAGAPSEFLDAFSMLYGPTMNAFEAAERSGRPNVCRRAGRIIQQSKQKPGQRYNVYSGDIPMCHGPSQLAHD